MKVLKKIKDLSQKKRLHHTIHSSFWFLVGFILAGLLLSGAIFAYFQFRYKDRAIPGIFLGNFYAGDKTKEEIQSYFDSKNKLIENSSFELKLDDFTATVSAKSLNISYDTNLMTEQSLMLGKTGNFFTDLYIILSSYTNGTYLSTSYSSNLDLLKIILSDLQKKIYKEPVDALFTVKNNRVIAFIESRDGKSIDFEKLSKEISEKIPQTSNDNGTKIFAVKIPIKITPPKVTTEKANNLGIVETIGVGNSQFLHSIPNRIHNVALAATKMDGILIAPNEVFSFDTALGDINRFNGYKEAYVIKEGRTVLGDGGGVCQVSTTLFRAILDAGLPILERHAHAYRVGYYEQNSPPGFDATIFYPTVDLKFKNDTGTYILIQSIVDSENLTLQFNLYGKKDNRKVEITKPIISRQTPPPPPKYQDDPTIPKGELRQVEHEAYGANVVFSRTVTKNGKKIIEETFASNYTPWQAVFLKGTKE